MKLMKQNNIVSLHRERIEQENLSSFYRKYLSAFKDCSEASPEFILSSLLASLGSTISLSRWIQWGTKQIYPNFWVLLIGESTRTRKSTALKIGTYFINKLNQKHPQRDFLLPARTSMSALLEVLAIEKQGILVHDEMATFLKLCDKGFNADMKSIFTTFFDVPGTYKLHFKNSGEQIFHKPIFSFAAASTPAWLKNNLKDDDLTSGFLARFLLCLPTCKRAPIPIPKQPDKQKVEEIGEVFEKLLNLSPKEIKYDEEFKKIYSKFYREIDEIIQHLSIDDGLKSLLSRLQTDYFLKFTILETTLAGKDIASRREAEQARYLVKFYMVQAASAIRKFSGSKEKDLEDRILGLVKEKGEISRTEFYEYIPNLTAQKLNRVIRALEKGELIVSEKKKRKRTVTVYRLNLQN